MKNIWAPWRIQYILSEKDGGCIFCDMPEQNRDRENLILLRQEHAYVIMNRFPYTGGHLMVVPYVHASSFEGLPDETLSQMTILTRLSVECLGQALRPDGFNAGINIGQAAGAGIEEHLHIHVVPRWVGDMSFMAALDEVHVIPEHLTVTYDKLKPVFMSHAERTQG